MLCARSKTFKGTSQASGSSLFLELTNIYLSIYLLLPPEHLTHLLEGIQLRLRRSCTNGCKESGMHTPPPTPAPTGHQLGFRPRIPPPSSSSVQLPLARPHKSHQFHIRSNATTSRAQKLRPPAPRHCGLHYSHVDRLLKVAGRTRGRREISKSSALHMAARMAIRNKTRAANPFAALCRI